MKEERIYIDGIMTNYTINEFGEVTNVTTGKKLKVSERGVVQLNVQGRNRGKMVARLVADAFIPNPDPEIYLYATNIDGDKTNNKLDNIKWITAGENSEHVWNIRRELGKTISTSGPRKKSENIVEKYKIEADERRVIIDGEETPYAITKEGRLRNLRTGNIIKGSVLASYPSANLRWDGKQKTKAFHRLVAEAWLPNPDNLPVVDHINGDRLNYHVNNLRWATHVENRENIHLDKTPKVERKNIEYSEEELNNETWIEHEETKLMVSNLGRVLGAKKVLVKGKILDCGYISYNKPGYNTGILGHVLVWEAFNKMKKPDKMVINHINGNKQDNRLSNLELVTQSENMRKAATETNAWNFRKVIEIDSEGNITRTFANASEAARAVGILPGSMRNTIRRKGRCSNGFRYEYVENEA